MYRPYVQTMFTTEPHTCTCRSYCSRHKMCTGLWQETIKFDIWRYQQKYSSFDYICNNNTFQILFIWKINKRKMMLCEEVKRTNSVYNLARRENHPSTLKVTWSIDNNHIMKIKSKIFTKHLYTFSIYTQNVIHFHLSIREGHQRGTSERDSCQIILECIYLIKLIYILYKFNWVKIYQRMAHIFFLLNEWYMYVFFSHKD